MSGESRRRRLRALLAQAGATRVDLAEIEAAFVHESAVRDRLADRSNERLEFLGDAVLGYVVARWLYDRYPDALEGELALRKSSLVSDAALAATAETLDLEPLLVLSAGLARLPPARRRQALADALEALLGALSRESGLDAVAEFIARAHLEPRERALDSIDDPKTLLQEWTQKHFATTPAYSERFEGPPHEPVFTSAVEVEGERLGEGSGSSKKSAQRAAAAAALEILRERYDDLGPRAFSAPVKLQGSKRKGRATARKAPRKSKASAAAQETPA